ncbi:MAG: amidohydrolase family protein [Gammaproteobacteria bacterium]|nr:amidohydrolase family protein [Gammaproteobacteria bacterium]
MHDLVIRGGTLIDGKGNDRVECDVAVDAGVVSAVGRVGERGREEIDARDRLVLPGWVDAHTHYDGQATWDADMTPSIWHGVTSLVMGNCGVGFAPARPEQHQWLIELMEGVEDIPGAALAEGVRYTWESFPEYLDTLEAMPRTLNVAAQMPHHALRVYVMGERAARHEPASAEDLEQMASLTEQAVRAGALGFTTSRTYVHRTSTGEPVPASDAAPSELLAIAAGLGRAGRGAFGLISDFEDESADMAWMRDIVRQSGRPLWFLLVRWDHEGDKWRRMLDRVSDARGDGIDIRAQVASRPIGALMGLGCSLHPFITHKTYRELRSLPVAERAARMRDPALRAAMLAEQVNPRSPLMQTVTRDFHKLYPMSEPMDYEPTFEQSVAGIAARQGVEPAALAYDLLSEGDGSRICFFPLVNYGDGDNETLREMMQHPGTLLGLGDGGAHCGTICDASMPTTLLTHWGRDRTRGERLPLEWLVKRQTWDNARYFGLHDRGRVEVGARADLNVIDFDALQVALPCMVHDLPAGGRRLIQRARGYEATIVNGEVVLRCDELTGLRPGRLLRGG